MKDILIFGAPRTGKTTLAKLLSQKLENYSLFSIDAIRNSFGDIFPELGINDPEIETNDMVKKNNETILPDYIARMLYWHHIELKDKQGYIVEGCQVLPDKAKEVFDMENSIVIYLGHGKLQPKEILRNIRKYDTPDEYSYQRTDEEMLKQCAEYYEIEKMIALKCKEYGFIYVDTSNNREKVLYELIDKLIIGENK